MHRLIVCFKSKDILRALSPGLAIIGIDVCKDVSNTILEQTDSVLVRIENLGTVPLSIEVHIGSQSVLCVNKDQAFDTVTMRIHHEFFEEVQNSIIVGRMRVSLKTGEILNSVALENLIDLPQNGISMDSPII